MAIMIKPSSTMMEVIQLVALAALQQVALRQAATAVPQQGIISVLAAEEAPAPIRQRMLLGPGPGKMTKQSDEADSPRINLVALQF